MVWKASVAGTALVVARILWLGLRQAYLKMLVYLSVVLVGSLILMLVGPGTTAYGWLYLTFQTINVFAAIFVVLELYRSTLADRPALAAYARGIAGFVMLGTAILVGVSAALDTRVPSGRSSILYHYFRFERSMDLIIVFLLLAMAVFLTWFPVKMKRNILLFGGGFFVFYLARASGLLLTNLMSPKAVVPVSNLMMAISVGCMVYWLVAMRKEGEDMDATTSFYRKPDRLAELTRQLDAINVAVSRFSRH